MEWYKKVLDNVHIIYIPKFHETPWMHNIQLTFHIAGACHSNRICFPKTWNGYWQKLSETLKPQMDISPYKHTDLTVITTKHVSPCKHTDLTVITTKQQNKHTHWCWCCNTSQPDFNKLSASWLVSVTALDGWQQDSCVCDFNRTRGSTGLWHTTLKLFRPP